MDTLQVNPTTGEVFLRPPAPHENISITPPRYSDGGDITLILNDPRVYKNLIGLPVPYHPHHAEEWLRTTKNVSDKILEDLREGKTVVDGCPVQHIREVQPDGTDLFLGDLSVSRYGWPEVTKEELRENMTKENLEKSGGDPSITWTFGDYLRPSHHGKGIMSAGVGAIINQWMVPRLKAHKIRAEVFEGNVGSVRVFEKNGMRLLRTLEVEREGEGCGGVERMHVSEWERPRE